MQASKSSAACPLEPTLTARRSPCGDRQEADSKTKMRKVWLASRVYRLVLETSSESNSYQAQLGGKDINSTGKT